MSDYGWTGGDIGHWYAYNTYAGVNPTSGNYFIGTYSSSTNFTYTWSTYQDVDVSSQATSINAGIIIAELTGYVQKSGSTGGAKIGLQALTSDGAATNLGDYSVGSSGAWEAIDKVGALPSGTAKLRVTLTGTSVTNGFAAFDDLSLKIMQDTRQAPVISTIANQTNVSGQTSDPVAFTISDADTVISSLTVSITSDNTTLIPNANITKTINSSDGNCTLSLTSTAGNTGSATITVAVGDGNKTTYQYFTVTVYPDVQIGSEVIVNGSGSSISGWQGDNSRFYYSGTFTVATVSSSTSYIYQDIVINKFAAPIDAGLLKYIASVKNGSTGNLIVQGFDSYGSKIFETNNISQNATIPATTRTLRVMVGGAVGKWVDDVSCKISSSNLPAMTTIAAQTMNAGVSTTIPFVVAYSGSSLSLSAGSSNTTLIPNAKLVISTSGYSRNITVTPASGQHGACVITISSGATTLGTINVTVVTVPGQPTNVTAIPGNSQATISFVAPADNGGSSITGYTVNASPGSQSVTGSGSPLTITGLANNQAYTFTVVASNDVGDSQPSLASSAITPLLIPTVANSTVTVSPSSVTANGTEESTVTVTLKDADNNPVNGKTVTLAQGSGSSSVITTVNGTTNASGQATFTVKNTVAESVTYTATDTTDGITVTDTETVNFVSGNPDAAQSTAEISDKPAPGVSRTVTITLKDTNGNLIKNTGISLKIDVTIVNNDQTTTEQYTVNGQACSAPAVVALNATSNDQGQITFVLGLPNTIDTGDGISIQVQTANSVNIGSKFIYPVADECFIATAAYGSKLQPAVVLLRQFRDKFLLTNKPGTAFVNFYYHNSPPVAKFIAQSEPLKALVRLLLLPLIALAYFLFHPIILGLIVVLILVLILCRRKFIKSGIAIN